MQERRSEVPIHMPGASTRTLSLAAASVALVLAATACGEANSSAAESGDGDSLAGSIAVDGSSTVYPIAQAVAEEFQIANPEVEVSVGFAGTGGGFEAFCAGDTDLSTASRPIEDDEAACLEDAGIDYTELQVAVDGLAIVTHPHTGWVDCITFDELRAIYEPGSEVSAWSDVNPQWPDEPIAIFGPDPDSGTYDYLAEEVADPDAEEPATRDDMTQSADDNVLVQGVAGEQGSIGYFGFAYFEENADQLKALEVDDGDSGCVAPTAETVKANEYPLSRPLFVYVANDAMDRPEVAAFVEFWVDGAAELASAVGYVEAPAEVTSANREALSDLTR
ncbi:MAG TPA: PstS family phosphate ABC transporter substrate-binding protein [Actinomycetota bacterium]|nr:PstS family phosphate ABC transporter substrate-binding protein [Actinomycetota bacterium]